MKALDFLDEVEESNTAEGFLSGVTLPSSEWRRVGDVGISALKGFIGVPESAVGLADLATGGYAGKIAEDVGFRPKEAKAFLDEYLSPQQQAANKALSDTKGFFPTIGTALKNPSTILHSAVESLPLMGAGGVVARSLMRTAGTSPWVAGAVGEGVASAGQNVEQVRQETPSGLIDAKQAASQVASGFGTGALALAGAGLARKLKIIDIDTLIAQGSLKAPIGASGKGFARRLAEGAISEGIFEELPQSLQEQMWQNYALNKPVMQGVPEAGAMSMLTGAVMGGPVAALAGNGQPTNVPSLKPELSARDKMLNSAAETVVQKSQADDLAAKADLAAVPVEATAATQATAGSPGLLNPEETQAEIIRTSDISRASNLRDVVQPVFLTGPRTDEQARAQITLDAEAARAAQLKQVQEDALAAVGRQPTQFAERFADAERVKAEQETRRQERAQTQAEQTAQSAQQAPADALKPQDTDLPILAKLARREALSEPEQATMVDKGYARRLDDGGLRMVEKGYRAFNSLRRTPRTHAMPDGTAMPGATHPAQPVAQPPITTKQPVIAPQPPIPLGATPVPAQPPAVVPAAQPAPATQAQQPVPSLQEVPSAAAPATTPPPASAVGPGAPVPPLAPVSASAERDVLKPATIVAETATQPPAVVSIPQAVEKTATSLQPAEPVLKEKQGSIADKTVTPVPKTNTLLSTIKQMGGITVTELADTTGESAKVGVKIIPGLFSKEGLGLDELATRLSEEHGYLIPETAKLSAVERLREMIQDAIRGKPSYKSGATEDTEFSKLAKDAEAKAKRNLADEMEAEGIPATEANADDLALMDRAADLDADGVERLAIEYEGRSNEEFRAAVKELVNAHLRRNEENRQAGAQASEAAQATPAVAAQAAEVAPLALAGQRPADLTPAAEQARVDEIARREERAIADRERDAFDLTPPAGPVVPRAENAAINQQDLLAQPANKYVDPDGNEINLKRRPSYGFMVTNAGMAAAEGENGTLWYERGNYPAKGQTVVAKVPESKFNDAWKQVLANRAAATKPASEMSAADLLRAAASKMDEAAQNPEQRSQPPVAESQAPVTSEPGKAGVAPGRELAVPEPWQMTQQEFDRAATDFADRVFQLRKTGEREGMRLDAGIGEWTAAARNLRYTSQGKRRSGYLTDQRSDFEVARQLAVEDAVRNGKPVPANVLADYPGLKPATPGRGADNTGAAALDQAWQKLSDADRQAVESEVGREVFDTAVTGWLEGKRLQVGQWLATVSVKVRAAFRTAVAFLASVAVAINVSNVNDARAFPRPQQAFSSTIQVSALVEKPTADFRGTDHSPFTGLLANWVVATKAHQGRAFIVADKPGGKLYAFDANGAVIGDAPALYGASMKDRLTPEQLSKPIEKMTADEKVTPAGQWTVTLNQDRDYEWTLDFEGGNGLAIHSVYLGAPSENRLARLASPSAADNFISWGCINVPADFEKSVLRQNFANRAGHGLFILPVQTETITDTFGIMAQDLMPDTVTTAQSIYSVQRGAEQPTTMGGDADRRRIRVQELRTGNRRRRNADIKARETDKGVAMFSGVEPEDAGVNAVAKDTPAIVQAVNDKIADDFNDPKWRNAYALAQPGTTRNALASAIEKVFGKTVVLLQQTAPEFSRLAGMSYGGKIYINTSIRNVGFVQIAGHELLHEIKRDTPALYDWFAKQAEPYLVQGAAERYRSKPEMAAAQDVDFHQEILADFTGDALADPAFLQTLAAESPSKFKQFVKAALAWFRSVASRLSKGGYGSSEYFTDVMAMRRYLASVLVAYSNRGDSAIAGVKEPQFSRPDQTQTPEFVAVDSLSEETVADITYTLQNKVAAFKEMDESDIKGQIVGLADEVVVARKTVLTASIKMAQRRGISETAVARFAERTTKAPPILVDGDRLIEGGHRLQAAIRRDDKTIEAVDVGPLLRADWDNWMAGGRKKPDDPVRSNINRGTFDPTNPDIRFSRNYANDTQAFVRSLPPIQDFLRSDRKLNRIISKINTPFHIAETHPQFKPVYDTGQAFYSDFSRIALGAADQAQDLLPRVEHVKDVLPASMGGPKSASKADIEAASRALYAGTLYGGGNPMNGMVWTDEELKGKENIERPLPAALKNNPLTDKQIKLYRQALDSINFSLDENAKSLIWRMAQNLKIDLDNGMALMDMATIARDQAQANIEDLGLKIEAEADTEAEGAGDRIASLRKQVKDLESFKASINDLLNKTHSLKTHGYFPAMRFGEHFVYAERVRPDGSREQLHFGLYERRGLIPANAVANNAKRELQKRYPDATVTSGLMNKEAHKLFNGLSLDALEVFAEHVQKAMGESLDLDPIMQEYFRMVASERSVYAREIHRKGVPGYSDDVPRVLGAFTLSNARHASSIYHTADMLRNVQNIDDGDLQAYATRYLRYLQDPQEEAHKVRGFLANYYILGSAAFGAINLTQPVMVTIPTLSEHVGYTKAAGYVTAAAKDVVKGHKTLQGAEQEASARAIREGVWAPQELHQIRAESQASMFGKNLAWRKALFAWGSIFSLTEQFNRGVSFLSAYRLATDQKMDNPYQFAVGVVAKTQFTYNRANRPELGRGPIGAVVMTFKQFTISYVELATRLYRTDKKAFAFLMLTLFAMAGLEGLPFAEDVEDIIDTIGHKLGFATNSKKALRKLTTELLGPMMSDILLHGVSAIPGAPIDVAQRIGMHNLIPGTAMFKTSEPDKARDIVQILGPAASIADRVILKGDQKGLLPLAVQNLVKANDMAMTGMYRDYRGRKVMDTTPADAFFKGVGFQPANVARESRIINENQQDIMLQKVIEDRIALQWAQGIFEKDQAKVTEARADLKEWNQDNPRLPVRIRGDQIQRRVREMRRTREERFVRSAAPEVRRFVRQDLQEARP